MSKSKEFKLAFRKITNVNSFSSDLFNLIVCSYSCSNECRASTSSPVWVLNLWNFAWVCPLCHIDVATRFNDKEKNATAHLLRQIHSHMHTQPQSQGLCGVTKATKTQELIIVIAVDSGIQTHTHAHSHEQAHGAAVTKSTPFWFCVNGPHA